MLRLVLCAAVIAAAIPASARAGGLLEEVSTGTTPQPQAASSAAWLTDKLAGTADPGDDWQIRLDLAGTHYFHIRATDLFLANLAVEYDPDAHWNLRLGAGGSPWSTSDSNLRV